ncbi:MAG: phosphatase PAP2 family protein [Candidatus Dormibacteraceae bacterium]
MGAAALGGVTASLRSRRRLLAAGSAAYLGLIFGVMLWRGIDIEPEWVVLALLVIAAALGRGRQFIQDWLPFLLLFFAYEVMRGFASKTGFPIHDVSGLERALFGGHLPNVVIQSHLYHAATISPYDWVAMGFYFLHFPLPIVVGFLFWVNSREHYWHFISALILMCFLAFATYLFYPTSPPWYTYQGAGPDHVVKIIDATIRKWGVAYFVSPVYTHMDPNKFAAFPSLHAAFPTLAAVYAWRRYRALAIGLVGYTLCVWFSIVYLGEHYFIDALCGVLFVGFAALAVEAFARWQRAPAPAS